jgi:solute carrier family 25 folate transporter 32
MNSKNAEQPATVVSSQSSKSIFSHLNWRTLAAGTAAGGASTAIFHPLELIKIRWQVYEDAKMKLSLTNKPVVLSTATTTPTYRPKYKSLLDTLTSIYKTENGVRGLYRGLPINVVASSSAWGIYFLVYNTLKSRHDTDANLLVNYTIDATCSGVFTLCFTNPLFLIKTRMCLQYTSANVTHVKYKSSWEALNSLVKSDGLLGLYKGFVPGLFGTLNGTIQMVTYDLMKHFWLKHLKKKNTDAQLDTFHYSTFSSLSKVLAVVVTYPFQLIKARLQDQHQNYKSVLDVVVRTYRHERFYGFYKGLIPCLVRVTPAASVTFIVYENMLLFLNKL